MNTRSPKAVLRLIAVVLFSVCAVPFAAGQTTKPADDKDTLQALLKEVTMLRQALQTLQRMSVDTYRSQILVDRIRINREDVRRLTSSLNETREMLSKTQQTIPSMTEQQKMLESRLQVEIDQAKRVEFEFEIKRAKNSIELYKSQIDPLKEREQQLSAELNKEKAELDELEGRLDLLERGIEDDRQKLENEKPASPKNP
jgi:predicted  nucleic acid-binding Zn-ribbon protein